MDSWKKDRQIMARTVKISKKIFPKGFNIAQMTEVGRAIYNGCSEDKITAEFINGMIESKKNMNKSKSEANNSKVDRFKEIVSSMAETYESKNKDYGNSFDKSIDKYGYVSFFVRSNDKIERAETIISNGKTEVKDESIMDTLLDNAVYNIMAALKVEEDIKNGNKIEFTKK